MLRQVTREIVEEKHAVTGRGETDTSRIRASVELQTSPSLLPSLAHLIPAAFLACHHPSLNFKPAIAHMFLSTRLVAVIE